MSWEVSWDHRGTQLHLLSSVCSAHQTFANPSNLFGRAARISGIFVKGFEGQPGVFDWEQMLWRSFSAAGMFVIFQDQLGKSIMRKYLCSLQHQGAEMWLGFFQGCTFKSVFISKPLSHVLPGGRRLLWEAEMKLTHPCQEFSTNKSKRALSLPGRQPGKKSLLTRQLGLSPSELSAKRKQLAAHVALQCEQ